jgi:hypothetical protein
VSDYWFEQRYDDLMFDEHTKGHPNSDSKLCPYEETLDEQERTGN